MSSFSPRAKPASPAQTALSTLLLPLTWPKAEAAFVLGGADESVKILGTTDLQIYVERILSGMVLSLVDSEPNTKSKWDIPLCSITSLEPNSTVDDIFFTYV